MFWGILLVVLFWGPNKSLGPLLVARINSSHWSRLEGDADVDAVLDEEVKEKFQERSKVRKPLL
eukprot:89419-Amphidinium_carterae.1